MDCAAGAFSSAGESPVVGVAVIRLRRSVSALRGFSDAAFFESGFTFALGCELLALGEASFCDELFALAVCSGFGMGDDDGDCASADLAPFDSEPLAA